MANVSVVEENIDSLAGPIPHVGKYDAAQIQVLPGLEAVRVRPAMYIGSTGVDGLHHLVWEIVDNSVDEAMAGFCSEIGVIIHEDGSLSVQDNGRGIPTGIHPIEKKPGVEIALTILHAGGKFENEAYGKSGGLHGVGAACVNALSRRCEVVVEQHGKSHRIVFERGRTIEPLKVIGTSKKTGTMVRFYPDEIIFTETTQFDYDAIANRLRQTAYLNAGLKITLLDERVEDPATKIFHYVNGLTEMVTYRNRSKGVLHEPLHFKGVVDDIDVDIALQYNDDYKDDVISFANNINTVMGGTHVTGFSAALTRVIKEFVSGLVSAKQKKDLEIDREDIREGLTAVVAVRVREAQFEGQTKGKLNNTEVRSAVEGFLTENLRTYFSENPKIIRSIADKVIQAAKGREAARKGRELHRKKSALEAGVLPGKLADCSSNNPEINELYLVEGDSAGGSAKQGRKREFQAILPLKGKVLNVERADVRKILGNEEIRAIITAIGAGFGKEFEPEGLRYHKIIIMTDADVDGSHIKTLILTLFFRHFYELIERGHIYLAMPPLYLVKKGKREKFVLTEKARNETVAEFGGTDEEGRRGIHIQRFKGLGELNPDQLWDTTMNPQTRVLQKVTIEDAMLADTLFSQLMGDDVEARRNFISVNATYTKNLDV